MLQLLGLIQCTCLPNHVFSKSFLNGHVRYMSDKSKKPTGDKKCTKKPEPVKADCKKNEPKKTETEIKGGTKCTTKSKPAEPKTTCAKSGGNSKPKCPCPRPPKSTNHATKWKRISLMGVLPLVAILTFVVFNSHHEEERPEFKRYTYLYQRTKPFFWGDGNHGLFHNSHWNALPPDGYEDEIDMEAAGKTPETDQERADRLKEFAAIQKEWKKKTRH